MRYMKNQEMVEEFHEAFSLAINEDLPLEEENMSSDTLDLLFLRDRLIEEEISEFFQAMDKSIDSKEAMADFLKEAADVLYVIYGYCVTFGYDLDEVFRRVHESNMSKLVDGKAIYDERGKVMKGPNYKKPDLSDLV